MSTGRDTQFAGFARALLDEVDGAYSEGEELQIIARRAYDLAWHVLNEFIGVVTDEAMDSIPDLTDFTPFDGSHKPFQSPGKIYSPDGVWLGDE